jgi:hypothetical protein
MPSLFRRRWVERCAEALTRCGKSSGAIRRRSARGLMLEQLETRCVPTTQVGPGKFSGTITSNTEFYSTNGTYEIDGPLTIQSGVTLTVDANVTVVIDAGDIVTDNGTLTFGSGAMVQAADTFGATGINVNAGTMTATGTTFSIGGNNDLAQATSLQVTNDGSVSASGCEFGWDNVTFNSGTVLSTSGTSNLANNAFDTILTLPATDVQYLGGTGRPGNKHFKQIDFAEADSVQAGQSVTLVLGFSKLSA